MPSGQETDWAYSITTVPGTLTGHVDPHGPCRDDQTNTQLNGAFVNKYRHKQEHSESPKSATAVALSP